MTTLCAHLRLPYPPSVNRYWRSAAVGGRSVKVYRSGAANAYRREVGTIAMVKRARGDVPKKPLRGELDVRIVARPRRQRRKRDADNLLKALLDALTYAGVIVDDSQFLDVRIRWGEPATTPSVDIALGRPADVSTADYLGLERPRA